MLLWREFPGGIKGSGEGAVEVAFGKPELGKSGVFERFPFPLEGFWREFERYCEVVNDVFDVEFGTPPLLCGLESVFCV